MTYLLDVNVLIALAYEGHVFHAAANRWADGRQLATCSVSEIGLVRVLCNLPEADFSVADGRRVLAKMKHERGMIQFSDDCSAQDLAAWVKQPRQVTDGHLCNVAGRHKATLATFDQGIPGAVLVPTVPA